MMACTLDNGDPKPILELQRQIHLLSQLTKGTISLIGSLVSAAEEGLSDQERREIYEQTAERQAKLWDAALEEWPLKESPDETG